MSELRDDLLDINGVGNTTADAVLEVLSDHDTGDVPGEVHEALDYLEADRPGYAAKYLRRLTEG